MRIETASALCVGELGARRPGAYPAHMTDLATKIRLLRQSLGLNQSQFAKRFGVQQASASRWETGSMPSPEILAKIADLMNVDVRSLLNADFAMVTGARPTLLVKGAVAAGVWREAVEWPDDEWIPYSGGAHVDAPLDRRFGLVVEGESMNMVYRPGTILDCVSTIGSGAYPRSGQRVIVVRKRNTGELEATVKEYVKEADGTEWLVPRSLNPAFQAPLAIGTGDDGIEETIIMAIVRGAYLPE